MDILFINSTEILSLNKEINGTLLLATKLLQADFDVDILRFGQIESFGGDYTTFIADIVREILNRDPKCVSFYTLWPHHHVMLRIAKEVKKARPQTIIVFGGPQASCTAEATLETMEFVDYVNTGEGEDTVVPLFRGILRGEGDLDTIPGLHYRKNGQILHNNNMVPLCDLDSLPRWDERLLLPQTDPTLHGRNYFMPIDVGRGCPYSCTFCCTSYFWRRVYRMKSADRIMSEIRYYYETYGIRSFWFSHDAFTINKKLVEEICDRILEEKLPIVWRCSARLDCISEELILKMKGAGMIQMELGVETGSPRMQKLINKNLDLEKARKMVTFLLKEKIRVGLFFMYGFPQETEEDLNQTLELIFSFIDQGVPYTSMFYCKFCPNTDLTEVYNDQLVFDPTVQMNFVHVYGAKEEEEMFRLSKEQFPFYYHLNTPVRNEYQYLHYLVTLYLNFAGPIRYLRRLYRGDNLKFYREFRAANRTLFDGKVEDLEKKTEEAPLELLLNLVNTLDIPQKTQLAELLTLGWNSHQVSEAEGDTQRIDTYRFNYVDLSLKRPIEQYTQGTSKILLEKKNGKFSLKVLDIQWS